MTNNIISSYSEEEESSHMVRSQQSIRRPIPRHPRQSSNPSCEHNCTCIHTNNPPAPISPLQSQNYQAYRRQTNDLRNLSDYSSAGVNLLAPRLAVENHYVTSSISEHSQTTNIPSVPCECGSSIQEPGTSDRSSSQQRCDDEQSENGTSNRWRECQNRCDSSTRSNKRILTTVEANHQRIQSSVRQEPKVNENPQGLVNEQKYSTCRLSENIYNRNGVGGIKVDEIIQSEEEVQGPPLPPRPHLRPRNVMNYRSRPGKDSILIKYFLRILFFMSTYMSIRYLYSLRLFSYDPIFTRDSIKVTDPFHQFRFV